MVNVSLGEGLGDLDTAIKLAAGHMPEPVISEARAVLGHSVSRRNFAHTVVALGGATGSGKSSLLNAIVGEPIARVAATRPTTSQPLAVAESSATGLLDWLGIYERHVKPGFGDLVLIDLPDIDSTEASNREIASRMTGLVDVVIWVLDPQKYADAVVHEDYLSQMSEHADVMLVLLNQADRLTPEVLAGVMTDVQRLVEADGVDVDVIATSAVTGMGIETVRQRLNDLVARKSAANERLAADVRTVGGALSGAAREDGAKETIQKPDFAPVARSLAKAAGADAVAKAAGGSYTYRARKATSWPLLRWIGKTKFDPLRRLRLIAPSGEVVPATGLSVSPTLASGARADLRRYTQEAVSHLPGKWGRDVLEQTEGNTAALLGGIDATISATDLDQNRKPFWWSLVNLLQWIALLTAIVGGVWLLLLTFGDYLQLRLPGPPGIGIFPTPTLMLAGGLLVGWLLSLLSRALVSRGAAVTEERVRGRLVEAVTGKAQTVVLEPLDAALADYQRFREATARLTQVH